MLILIFKFPLRCPAALSALPITARGLAAGGGAGARFSSYNRDWCGTDT